jgi:protein-S-isoprenylcysteine O-methyltransferase Ste14
MQALRIALLIGLAFHKILWEVLKRRNSNSPSRQPSTKPFAKPLKAVKVGVLLFLVVQTLFLDVFPIANEATSLRLVGAVIFFLGLAIAIIGRLEIGRNWIDLEDYQLLPQQSLVTSGIYSLIRHPIYFGDLLLVIGLQLALNSWLVLGSLLLIPVVVKQALAEEKLLSVAFPEYEIYRKRTKGFVPFVV